MNAKENDDLCCDQCIVSCMLVGVGNRPNRTGLRDRLRMWRATVAFPVATSHNVSVDTKNCASSTLMQKTLQKQT